MRLLIACVATALFTSPAMAQDNDLSDAEQDEVIDRSCGDDRGRDRCDPELQARMRALYGITDTSTLLEEGTTVRRAMFVNGYGSDIAAIAFSRRPGQSPTVEVFTPPAYDGPQTSPLRAVIDGETWTRVLSRSEYFDQPLAREVRSAETLDSGDGAIRSADDAIRICFHSSVVVVESVDAERVRGYRPRSSGRDLLLPLEVNMAPGVIRQDVESGCYRGLAIEYAYTLAELAHGALPECSGLDPEDFRGLPHLLAHCQTLGGDRIAAAVADSIRNDLLDALDEEQDRQLERLFVFTKAELSQLLREAIGDGILYMDAPAAADADHATIQGEIVYYLNEDDDTTEIADITLQLLRRSGSFRIDTFEISARRPLEFEQ